MEKTAPHAYPYFRINREKSQEGRRDFLENFSVDGKNSISRFKIKLRIDS